MCGAQKIWLLYQEEALEADRKWGFLAPWFPGRPPGGQGERFSYFLTPNASLRSPKAREKKGRKVNVFEMEESEGIFVL